MTINAETIKRMADEVGQETLTLLLNVFSDELEQYQRQLLDQPTISEVREICHSLKSSAASFGADELADMAQECESRVKQGQDEWIVTHLPEFRQMVEGMAIEYKRLACHDNPVNSLF
ncbi:Hpt domain-containing protein [Photobacterium gaetbulicola]|uniref:Phosphorelay protein n=2 Tax=Photobacterium gaetbulicola TaxID=1295392 RepID=A0A0C5WLN2_9GAMM|nr:Hpt domain-containing protein [Photobacterium gaetbulicola]AJR08073.1 phosphorelay protein [Photobacterium gaetbulicola Gung47]KHT65383.1 phosphorelay protein LuxU [Photobacterium gaetbulicola]PSU12959.1 Hpt domain-containing protein [Photobacterium gaetbulicola]